MTNTAGEHAKALRELYDQALRRVTNREYGEEELRRKLKQYSDNKQDIDTVLDQMKQAGHLSDDRFIEAYIQSRVRRGFGPLRITAELREKSIRIDAIKQYLSIWQTSWLSLAKRVLEKKHSEKRKRLNIVQNDLSDEEGQQSYSLAARRFLTYRGFDPEIIQQAITEQFSEQFSEKDSEESVQ